MEIKSNVITKSSEIIENNCSENKDKEYFIMKKLILSEINNREENLEKIRKEKNLEKKCLMFRFLLKPQSCSGIVEETFRNFFGFKKTIDSIGDFVNKKGEICELKYSGFSKSEQFNFVQIRPHQHNIIKYYYLIIYNILDKSTDFGKLYIFVLRSEIIEELIVKYGHYAHGTKEKNGKISKENFKTHEYALRPKINNKLWNDMVKHNINSYTIF